MVGTRITEIREIVARIKKMKTEVYIEGRNHSAIAYFSLGDYANDAWALTLLIDEYDKEIGL
jgi:PHD/YefM family antitoxin component YafN of YafNO toxin-antitoxin module